MKWGHYTVIRLDCAVCGRSSRDIEIPFYFDPTAYEGRYSQEQLQKVKQLREETGYLTVKLYDKHEPTCCRECAENLLGRRSVDMKGGGA